MPEMNLRSIDHFISNVSRVETIMLLASVLLFICCVGLLDTCSAFVNMLHASDVNNASSFLGMIVYYCRFRM